MFIVLKLKAQMALALSSLLILNGFVFEPLPARAQLLQPQPIITPITGSKIPTIVQPQLSFSTIVSDLELKTARILPEPLAPSSALKDDLENKALAQALLAFKQRSDEEDISALTDFLDQNPDSRWSASIELNLGLNRFERGYLTSALRFFKAAWEAAKGESTREQKLVANRAISEFLLLSARLGRTEEIQQQLDEIKGRKFEGSEELLVRSAQEGLHCMKAHPEIAFKCGPFAVDSLLFKDSRNQKRSALVESTPSTTRGTNLAQVKDLADQSGLHLQIAKRTAGAPLVVPAIMHWSVNHFAALTAFRNGKYQLKDPTFDTDANKWISQKAIDEESDGYFLIAAGPLPQGWQTVSIAEAENVWGKGNAPSRDEPAKTDGAPTTNMGPPAPGGKCMAVAQAFTMQATLNIKDTPLSYSPPVGPGMDFSLNYNYLEANQPATFTFPNFGPNWSFNWISYLMLDSSQNATVRVRGGGSEIYSYTQPDNVGSPYAPNLLSQAQLVVVNPGVYQRLLPDGSIEQFDQPDGTGRIFMTRLYDPQGNFASIQYDSNFRVTSITDAIGQVSSVSYVSNTVGNSGFYKIATITDPFSPAPRSASFAYDSSNTNLIRITDSIGLQSQFVYDTTNSFITVLTTPYGATSFYQYESGDKRGLRFKFPDNTFSVIENWIGPYSQSYFWDRHALSLYPFDPDNGIYTHSEVTQFCLQPSTNVEASVIDYIQPQLDTLTQFSYPGETHIAHNYTGTSNRPIQIVRALDVPNHINQTYTFEYNDFGQVTKSVDPIGRTFSYFYAANNVDLLEVRQTKGTNNDLLGKWQYNSQHRPTLFIDGSGQRTQAAYNSFGEVTSITDPNNNATTLTYNSNGYLTQVDGPMPGSNDITTMTYDGYGRLLTETDSEGYARTYSYDNANRRTKTTYLDGTSDRIVFDRLDAVFLVDRLGRTTTRVFNSLDQLASEVDPLGRKTQYAWCTCGSLKTLTDPAGNVTKWDHDLEGRIVTKTYADNSSISYSYGTAGETSGLLKSRTDALNQTTNYSYNLDDTLAQISYTNAVNPTSTVTISYDQTYPRMSSIQNGWGTHTFSYNSYITDPFGTATTGGGRLSSVTNNVISNSAVTYSFDALGRTTNRSINGSSNSITWSYDQMSRVTSEVSALGTFNYAYMNDASGASKGDPRLASISYPNGQTTQFSYYPASEDLRLRQISNLSSGGATISQFNYRYNPAGEITHWGQLQNNTSLLYSLGYDSAGQLIAAQAGNGIAGPTLLEQYYYAYDSAANRTAVQKNVVTRIRVSGSATAGDTITLTVIDPGLSGGSKNVTYTVVSGDTLSSITAALAAAINADTSLQSLGVNAATNSNVLSIKSVSKDVTTYSGSVSAGATETLAFRVTNNFVESAAIGGTKTTGDVLTITVKDPALTGGSRAVSYTVVSADTLTSIATGIKNAINADTALAGIGVSATSASTVVTITSTSTNATTYAQSTSSGATETVTLSINFNALHQAAIGGTKTTGDVLTFTVFDPALSGGSQAVSYTVASGDTLSTIAAGIATAINANTNLSAIGVTASSAGVVVNLNSNSLNLTEYRSSLSSGATESVLFGLPPIGTQTAALGGTVTAGNTVTITVYDPALTGGSKAITYTVVSGDTLNSIAAGLASAINADTALQAVAVSATSTNSIVNLKSASINNTTYTASVSSGATESISLAPNTVVLQSTYNNLNELTSISAGGLTRFHGTTSKPVKSVTVNTTPQLLPWSKQFIGNTSLSTGNNSTSVVATDAAPNTKTNTYQISLNNASGATVTHDANGNMTSDGTNTFSWDAENRLTQITYPGTNNRSELAYDGLGRCVKIVEITAGSTTSTKQFIWCGTDRCEERDAAGSLTKQFFALGQRNGSSNYSYALNHLGSVTEMTDSSGTIQAQYSYSPWGEPTAISEIVSSDSGFAGMYFHQRSGLNLTMFRVYFPKVSHWLSRDPIGESVAFNLYGYGGINNDPIRFIDPLGLDGAYVAAGGRAGTTRPVDINYREPNLEPFTGTDAGPEIGVIAAHGDPYGTVYSGRDIFWPWPDPRPRPLRGLELGDAAAKLKGKKMGVLSACYSARKPKSGRSAAGKLADKSGIPILGYSGMVLPNGTPYPMDSPVYVFLPNVDRPIGPFNAPESAADFSQLANIAAKAAASK